MFAFFKRNFINEHKKKVETYIVKTYEALPQSNKQLFLRYALTINAKETIEKGSNATYDDRKPRVQYSLKSPIEKEDKFDSIAVSEAMKSYLGEDIPVKPLSSMINLTFVNKLLFYIKEKNFTEPEVYKAAQIDRRLFSKIICNQNYKPSKDTVLAFIFALRLNLNEGKDLLERAGYTLSHSIRRDIILEYFIKERVYNLSNINAFLYHMSEKIIGRNI